MDQLLQSRFICYGLILRQIEEVKTANLRHEHRKNVVMYRKGIKDESSGNVEVKGDASSNTWQFL